MHVILRKEPQSFKRKLMESIFIYKNKYKATDCAKIINATSIDFK